MKFAILVMISVLASVASAQSFDLPRLDFSMQTDYEMGVIAADANVRAYAGQLGAQSYSINNGKPALQMYAVQTNNGCSFDVEVVYQQWPGVDAVIVYAAKCK